MTSHPSNGRANQAGTTATPGSMDAGFGPTSYCP